MAALKLLNLLALTSVAILAISSGPTQVNALATGRSQVARHVRNHERIAERKRDASSTGRCKPRPTSSIAATSSPPPPPPPTTTTPPPPPPTTTSAPPPPPPSSSAPAPSPSASAIPKWGLAYPEGDTPWLSNFFLQNVGFLYTWSPSLPSNLPPNIHGIPMVWGWNQVDEFQSTVVAGYASYALGPNEPNEPSQSNMSPSSAVQLWMTYMQPLVSQGYTLISPACTNDDSGLLWYQQFFDECNQQGCTVHKVAMHAYTTNATAIIDYATTLYNSYQMPIWITEFADQNYSGEGGQADMDEVWAFAGEMIDFVNNTPWLEVAFPFGVMGDLQGVNPDNALLTSDNTPTSLAYTYFG